MGRTLYNIEVLRPTACSKVYFVDMIVIFISWFITRATYQNANNRKSKVGMNGINLNY